MPRDVDLRRDGIEASIRRTDYLSVKPLIDWITSEGCKYADGILLDYGCGNQPYRELWGKNVKQYVGVDVTQNKFGTVTDVVPPNSPLPYQDNSFDTVVSTQVLEHVSEPKFYLSEAARVLRPGGNLILTCPGTYMLHEEPFDFFRYTEHGLRYLLESNGISILVLDTTGGAWRVVGQTIINHCTFGRRRLIPVVSKITHAAITIITNISCTMLDKINTNRKEVCNYLIIAKKRQAI